MQDVGHAAASVHATVMSEEDAQSEGDTKLSSLRREASCSAPAPGTDAAATQEQAACSGEAAERHAARHPAGAALHACALPAL